MLFSTNKRHKRTKKQVGHHHVIDEHQGDPVGDVVKAEHLVEAVAPQGDTQPAFPPTPKRPGPGLNGVYLKEETKKAIEKK